MRLKNVIKARDILLYRLMYAVVVIKLILGELNAKKGSTTNPLAQALSYEDWQYYKKPRIIDGKKVRTYVKRRFASNIAY